MLKSKFLVIFAFLLLLSVSVKAELIAYYPMDEGSGNALIDATGNQEDGVIDNGITWVDGPPGMGKALEFNGSGSHVTLGTWNNVGSYDSGTNTGSMTVAFWVKSYENSGYEITVCKRQSWAWTNPPQMWFVESNNGNYYLGGNNYNNLSSPDPYPLNEWIHLAFTVDTDGTAILYQNGVEVVRISGYTFYPDNEDNPICIGADGGSGNGFEGIIDDVQLYDTALTASEIPSLMTGAGKTNYPAMRPNPKDGAKDVDYHTTLRWTAGKYADTHNVFFGTDFNDVNDSTIDVLLGETIVSPSQAVDANMFSPGTLKFEKDYYWRVDEVNAPGDDTVYKGPVWSFTTEQYSYKIPVDNIVNVMASSSSQGDEPNDTKNESGLNPKDMDLHSNVNETMWLNNGTDVNGAWIRYDFDKPYKLHQMLVWNYNVGFFLSAGFKDVTVEYKVSDQNWIELENVTEFAKGTGASGYEYNTTVDFNGVTAQSVRLTAHSNWSEGASTYYGLSEVRFMYIPVWASEPNPEDKTGNVAVDQDLSWRSGRDVSLHYLYLDTDMNSVANNLVSPIILGQASYLPDLGFGQTYYWKVDEVNESEDTATWDGPVWSFSTPEFALIENFEDYNNISPYTIFDTWLDGLADSDYGGSQMGNNDFPYSESTIVYNGRFSAPFYYDNSGSYDWSETERIFDTPQDWEHNSADTLRLFYYGQPGEFTVSGDSIAMSGAGADFYTTVEEFRFAYKTLTGDGSIAVRIDGVGGGGDYPKAGIIIRDGLEDGAPLASLFREAYGTGYAYYRTRASQDGSLANVSGASLTGANAATPLWLKLTRSGTTITAETSDDGITWIPVRDSGTNPTTAEITMSSEVCIGFFVSANSATVAAGGIFSNITTTGDIIGDWEIADIGGEQDFDVPNTLDSLYIALTDSSNKSYKVKAPELAVFSVGWTEWLIPYSDFVGVDMSKIKKITLGVGGSGNQMKGEGKIFFDYISYGHPSE